MIYCIDVDGTLCTLSNHYVDAKPIKKMIDKVNALYDAGHTIKIYTARGQATGVSYTDLTRKQLEEWEVKYHHLIMGKPSADIYVDDKARTPYSFDLEKTDMVFTNGCFDIIHAGHIKLLKEAACYGRVVVGLNSDRSVSKLKEGRPINDEESRRIVLSSISYVWNVVMFGQETPEQLIQQLKPNVLVKGSDWKGKEIAGAEFVKANGGKVVLVDLLPGFSTTKILEGK